MATKIMIVEDDDTIAALICQYLNQWGFKAQPAKDLTAVDQEIAKFDPKLVIMDINLPHVNGFHWLTLLRQRSKIPVIFLTAAGDDMNLVMAMNLGADDFLTKPIELPVLLAKVQGLLRRAYQYQELRTSYTLGDYQLLPADNQLTRKGRAVTLTPNETKLLTLLFAAQGQLVPRETMMEKLWEGDQYIDRNALAVTVTRLRQKIQPLALDRYLQTVKGKGYLLEVPQ